MNQAHQPSHTFMKAPLLALLALVSTGLAAGGPIIIKVTDEKGTPVEKADVVAILKSGAYQNTKFVNGAYVCEAPEECVKVYVGAPGREAAVTKYSGASGSVDVTLKPNAAKGSAVVRGKGSLPGIDGTVTPILDGQKTYMYSSKIGLVLNGRAADQPLHFAMKRPIEAVSSTGKKFKIEVLDITPQVALVEFTVPK